MPRETLLLTGGTGFFGRALLRHWLVLAEQGKAVPAVTVLSRSPEPFLDCYPLFRNQAWLSFRRGDVLAKSSLPFDQTFTYLLHAATDSTLGPRLSPLERYDQIVDGTRNVLDLAVACGTRRFLLTSSGGVYGPQPADMANIPEDYCGMPDPLDPSNAYAVAKRAAEHLCALYGQAHGLETVIARCFAFVGQDLPLDVHFAIGNFIRDALWAEEIMVTGGGTAVRSYLDQRDLAAWLLTLLERGRADRAYNVGSNEAISVANLARMVRDELAPGKPVRILGQADARDGRHRYVPDISQAQNELDVRVTIPLPQAITDAAAAIVAARMDAT